MSPLGYVKLAAIAAVAFYVMSLKLEIAEQNTQIEVYKSNETALKDAVETAKETNKVTAGLLARSQEASNENFKAFQTVNNDYISAIGINSDLQRRLDAAIKTRPVAAALDVNNRSTSLRDAFWRKRRAYRSTEGASNSETAPNGPPDDGKQAKGADIRGDQ